MDSGYTVNQHFIHTSHIKRFKRAH